MLGGLGTFAALIVVMALDPARWRSAAGWMLFGIASTSLYRRSQGLPLTQTVKVVTPEPLGVEEVEYRSILVAFEDDPFSRGDGRRPRPGSPRPAPRAIHVLSLLNVPTNLPLDAPLDREEGEAQSKIEQAKLIGGLRVTGHVAAGPPGAGGPRDRRRGARDRGGGDRDAAHATATAPRCRGRRSRRCWRSAPAG